MISDCRLREVPCSGNKFSCAGERNKEVYWKQKIKKSLLRGGDRNTKFFHGSVQKRKAQNKIPVLVTSNGVKQFSEGSKADTAVD